MFLFLAFDAYFYLESWLLLHGEVRVLHEKSWKETWCSWCSRAIWQTQPPIRVLRAISRMIMLCAPRSLFIFIFSQIIFSMCLIAVFGCGQTERHIYERNTLASHHYYISFESQSNQYCTVIQYAKRSHVHNVRNSPVAAIIMPLSPMHIHNVWCLHRKFHIFRNNIINIINIYGHDYANSIPVISPMALNIKVILRLHPKQSMVL